MDRRRQIRLQYHLAARRGSLLAILQPVPRFSHRRALPEHDPVAIQRLALRPRYARPGRRHRLLHPQSVLLQSEEPDHLLRHRSLSLAFLASIAGRIAIFWNGASYTQKFSTVLRTTTGLGQVVAENDRSGADPLPKYLSRARVDLGRAEEKTMELGQVSETVGERSAMIDSEGDWRKEPGIVHERSLSEER
jgi:hypothetical protein